MAIYTCTTQEGTLSAEQRAVIAAEITRIHSTHTGEPASFVWVIFETVSPDSIYSGGKPALNALIVGIFREAQYGSQSSGAERTVVHVQERHWSVGLPALGIVDGYLC